MNNTIKRTTLLTAVFALLTMTLFSQTISVGVKTGFTSNNIAKPEFIETLEVIPEFRNLETMNFGLVSEIGFSENFAIQPELNFTTKGFKIRESANINIYEMPLPLGVTAVSKFNYVEVPVLAKAKFGTGKTQAYVVAGPTLGYATGGKLETRANILFEIDLYETPLDLNSIGYERFEVGGTVGGGVAFDTGGGQLFVDARYSHGFTEVYDIPIVRERVQNKSFGINAGYMIRF
jgi:hypothetical protein